MNTYASCYVEVIQRCDFCLNALNRTSAETEVLLSSKLVPWQKTASGHHGEVCIFYK
jgi:hypothetical protein